MIFEKRPEGWRIGQTIFNFLYWLGQNGYEYANTMGDRGLGDPFPIPDHKLEILYKQFLREIENEQF